MSENEPASTCEIVSITEAAARLDCSVRTVQRRLDSGALDSIEVDGQRRVKLSHDNATANATHDTTGRQSDATPGTPPNATTRQNDTTQRDIKHESQRDTTRHDTRQVTRHNATGNATPNATESAPQVLAGAFSDNGSARVIEILERENAFLKSQIESANRQASEAHAALRAIIAAQPKALTAGTSNDGSAAKSQADESAAQVLAGATPDEMQGSGGALDTMAAKETAAKASAPQIGSTARDGRGLRGWLLKVLRG